MRFAEVYDPHHVFTMLHKARQVKHESVQIYIERLYAPAHDAFTKVDKVVVELQLMGFFIDGLYHDFLCVMVMTAHPKHFSLQYSLHWQNKIF